MRKRRRELGCAIRAVVVGICGLMPRMGQAANTVYFSTSSAGQIKSIAQWGVEVVDGNSDNMRQSIANMGANNIDLIAMNFWVDEALQANGQIGPNSIARINAQLAVAAMAGNKPIIIGPNVGSTDASYLSGSQVNVSQWVAVVQATKSYLNSQGWTLGAVSPFNEPDYWSGQGTTTNLHDIMVGLRSDPTFNSVALVGASTLSSDPAQSWYNAISGVTTYGSTHVLGGSATSYANFFQSVSAAGGIPAAPELHGLGEAIYAAEYGVQSAQWWGPALRARGQFVQASQGQQLGYAENRANDTAATVYRAPSGNLQAFAGGFERMGTSTPYRFVSTDRDVFFNGVGPIRQYMIQAGQGDEAFADIQYGTNIEPALDGNQWEIVNRQTGQALQVSGGGTGNGALVNSATYVGASYQQWNITRNKDGYYALNNANSGLTLDIFNGSLADGGSADQWGNADNLIQQWYIQSAGGGYYYLRNANSNSYLTSSTSNAFQVANPTSNLQQWQFVQLNTVATGTLTAQYKFEGNVNDSTGANNATVFGSPSYGSGPTTAQGQAITLNGTTNYVQLPSGVANTKNITISAWVKWNGGAAWQRIFDFGNNTTQYMFLTPNSGDGTMRFSITTSGGTGEQILDTDPLPTGQWVHLAVTLNGNTGVLYVNGVPMVAGQILLNPSDINPTLNYLGKSQFADPLFSGMIDDFRIYNFALNQSQIANLLPISHYSWTGSASAVWSTATAPSPKNWKLAFDSSATDYLDGDTVVFDDSATSFVVITGSNVSPIATTFYNTISYTFVGGAGISGTGSVTKNGTGIVNINNVNTYTGATTLNIGTINLNGSLAGSAVTVNTGTFSESASGAITGSVALTNSGITVLGGTNSLGAIRATGPGTITINGGTTSTSTSGQVSVGDTTGDNAVLNVSAGALNANTISAPSIVIGSANLATGTMTVSGGTVNAASEVWVSSTTGGAGTLNVSGGTVNVGSWLAIGRGGDNGNLNVTGGSVNVNGFNLTLASFGGSAGQATISGGTVTTVNSVYVGEGGTGTLTISGTGNVVANGSEGVRVGRNGGSVGTVNLNPGGTLTTTGATGGAGTSTFNFNGGTLRAAGDNTAFLQGLGTAKVQAGGAIVNTNGKSIMISQPLVHDAVLAGTPDGGLTKNGSGTLALNATNSYTGGTTVNGGSLIFAAAADRPVGDKLTINDTNGISAGKVAVQGDAVNMASYRTQLLAGYNSGHWSAASGITSTSANTGSHTAVGYLTGAEYLAFHGAADFAGGYSVASSDVLLRYTYTGDATLDGQITVADYAQIDSAFLLGVAGAKDWFNGDFNYDGVVNYLDYALIDAAFAAQSGPLADGEIAAHAMEFGGPYLAALGAAEGGGGSVPEPGMLGVMGLGVAGLVRRRGRRVRTGCGGLCEVT